MRLSRVWWLGGVIAAAAAVCVAVAIAGPGSARAGAGAPLWQLEQPPPPPPPPGVVGVGRALGLGQIGDVKFWAPNRGLLITGGNPPAVPKGLWSYDGVSWHLLSTVCGSAVGRIAWAGPDEFWTISDPAPNSQYAAQLGTTLCHFVNGAVVASYATPAAAFDPYRQMFAAACNGPDDCWFAGQDASAPLTGTFHLHWDGNAVTDVLGPQDRAVNGLAALNGQFFESVWAAPQDQPVAAETNPALLHRLVPGVDPSAEFVAEPFTPASCPSTDAYLTLGTDGTELWAVGGDSQASQAPCFARPALAARFVAGTFEEVGVNASQFVDASGNPYAFLGVAPEAAAADAWVTVGPSGYTNGEPPTERAPYPPALVARIANDGTTLEYDTVPATGSGQSNHGAAGGPISCPALNDCWMVTREGWLYHLTDGTVYPQDTDPHFASLIDLRPPDAGTATFPPDTSPFDNSEQNQKVVYTPPRKPKVKVPKPKPLVVHVHEHLRGLTLQLSFTLNFRSHVLFAALRGHQVVASTGNHILKAGRHVLSLALARSAWPNRLRFSVVPIKFKVRAGG